MECVTESSARLTDGTIHTKSSHGVTGTLFGIPLGEGTVIFDFAGLTLPTIQNKKQENGTRDRGTHFCYLLLLNSPTMDL